jgi:hypothetical protein
MEDATPITRQWINEPRRKKCPSVTHTRGSISRRQRDWRRRRLPSLSLFPNEAPRPSPLAPRPSRHRAAFVAPSRRFRRRVVSRHRACANEPACLCTTSYPAGSPSQRPARTRVTERHVDFTSTVLCSIASYPALVHGACSPSVAPRRHAAATRAERRAGPARLAPRRLARAYRASRASSCAVPHVRTSFGSFRAPRSRTPCPLAPHLAAPPTGATLASHRSGSRVTSRNRAGAGH